ncbi:uncharacterized protein LOC111703357 isoform X2 [Eurytemora carolleeae]|uniref:uncharacterized protein LOC111703357 isoform X2 n=1 Tax=Eurytemora carolleeae TaxID=1294199 RepID=UPI000C78B619|nr:uncharacterized protein LOC111703357 isoform X2 [Eurytemora carolleeae]|eukprot:XP_023331038.1 uncharacterized protein LOC111703357 isoform X2 [Eurytemora affinis]
MLAWAPPDEIFVNCPGIIEIRWKYDDPLICKPSVDLFDEQKKGKGLSESHGKKDKQTSEQSYFRCLLCECDLMSVITLRAHKGGAQHTLKALKKYGEYKKELANRPNREPSPQVESKFLDLYAALEHKQTDIVGFKYITEYCDDTNPNHNPLYHCSLRDCRNAQGDAEFMQRHMMKLIHRGSWVEATSGMYMARSEDVIAYVRNHSESLQGDYCKMNQVNNREKYLQCKDKRISVSPLRESIKRERPVEYDRPFSPERKYKRERSASMHRSRSPNDFSRSSPDSFRSRSSRDGSGSSREGSRNSRSRSSEIRDRRRSSRDRLRSPRDRSRSSRERSRSYQDPSSAASSGIDSLGEESSMEIKTERRPRKDDQTSSRVKVEYGSEPGSRLNPGSDEDVSILKERGSFDFKDVSNIKPDTQPAQVDTVEFVTAFAPEKPVLSEKEIVLDFHKQVADCVKSQLNKHYPECDYYEPGFKRISKQEYVTLAKSFSHDLRDKLKAAYLDYNQSYEGLTMISFLLR